MEKRALSLLLALVMVFGLLPVTAQAGQLDNGLKYEVYEDHVEITGYTGSDAEVVIPAEIEGLPVTSIGDYAFYGCDSLTSISIPDSVTSIGSQAFSFCPSLISVSVPDSVVSIGKMAFYECYSLTGIHVDPNNPNYSSDDRGVLFDKQKTELIQVPCAIEGAYVIPNSVTSIGQSAFHYCMNMPSLVIPDGVTSIGHAAFYACSSMTSISIPDSVTSIGLSAFVYCAALTSIVIPDGITSIGASSFHWCIKLTSISIPDSVTFIDDKAFYGCESLSDVYYSGSEAQWNTITFGSENECLTNATIHFEPTGPEQPIEPNPIIEDNPTYMDFARTEWIEQHMEYAASDEYKQDIVREFTGCLNDVFVDIKNDDAIRSYATLDSINQILEFDIDLNEAQEYELLLGQIFFSYIGEDAIEEIYAENMTRTVIMLGELMLKSDDFKQIGDSKQLEGILDALKSSEGVDKMNAACDSFFNFVDGYDNLNIKKHLADNIKEESFNLAWDVAIDSLDLVTTTLKELTMYVAAGEAYSHTSDAFGKLLLMMRQNIDVDSNNPIFQPIPSKDLVTNEVIWNLTATSVSPFHDPLNTPVVLKDLATAIESFYLSIETYKNEDSTYIAQNALADLKDGTVNDVLINNCENAAVSLFSCLPIVREYKTMKDILSTGQSLIDIMTSIDDQEYLGTMFIRLYCISYLHYLTINNLAGPAESWESVPLDYNSTPGTILITNRNQDLYGYQFMRATSFDEAVNVYKSISVVAADYALKYTNIFLGEALVELNTYDNGGFFEQFLKNRDKLVQAVNDYKNTVVKLENQRTEIQAISCHDADLQYDSVNDEIIYNFKDSRIYVVACPVDVIVKNESGEQIAYLSGEDNEVMEGYEFYFHTIKMPDESGEYIKVAIVPDGYRVELVGTDDGTMNAFVTDFTSGDVGEIETYFNIPIGKDSVGYFEISSEKTNESGLVMDQVVYSNMESIEDVPTNSESDGVWLYILGGTIVCVIILILVFKKKSRE